MDTRKQSQIAGLGGMITLDDQFITGCKLPTIRQVLRCYRCHLEIIGYKSKDSMKEVISQLELYYNKANIPMLSEARLMIYIRKEIDENKKCRKFGTKLKDSEQANLCNEKEMARLNSTFKAYPIDALDKIKIEEDALFLKSMMTDRVATMAGLDQVTVNKAKKKRAREEAEEKRKAKMLKESNISYSYEDNETGYLLLNVKNMKKIFKRKFVGFN
jgi:hypothetical protein